LRSHDIALSFLHETHGVLDHLSLPAIAGNCKLGTIQLHGCVTRDNRRTKSNLWKFLNIGMMAAIWRLPFQARDT